MIRILLNSTLTDIRTGEVATALIDSPGVLSVHHPHVCRLDEPHPALEAHVVMSEGATYGVALKRLIRQLLMDRFRIGHCTIELEGLAEARICGNHKSVPGSYELPGRAPV